MWRKGKIRRRLDGYLQIEEKKEDYELNEEGPEENRNK